MLFFSSFLRRQYYRLGYCVDIKRERTRRRGTSLTSKGGSPSAVSGPSLPTKGFSRRTEDVPHVRTVFLFRLFHSTPVPYPFTTTLVLFLYKICTLIPSILLSLFYSKGLGVKVLGLQGPLEVFISSVGLFPVMGLTRECD